MDFIAVDGSIVVNFLKVSKPPSKPVTIFLQNMVNSDQDKEKMSTIYKLSIF